MTGTNHKVLMITAAWPPVARVGVRRPLRLARRLPNLGWDPVVLTPDPRSIFRKLPTIDESLSVPDVEVHTVSAFIPSTLISRGLKILPGLVGRTANRLITDSLKPDQYPSWTRAALKAVKGLNDIEVVWVTGGPFGIFCVAQKVAQKLGVPLILDYRDPWTVDLSRKLNPFGPSNKALRALESKLLDSAQGVSYVNTDMLARNVAAFNPKSDARWVVIPNGYDALDVGHVAPKKFAVPTLVYAGACYGSRSMLPILTALADAERRGLPALKLRIFGELDPSARQFLDKHPLTGRVDISSRIPARQLAAEMRGATALLLIIGETHRTALSAKVFDYLEAGQPIIGYGPEGCAASTMIEQCGIGWWASDGPHLQDLLFRIAQSRLTTEPESERLRAYSADVMAERTAQLLDTVRVGSGS